MSKPRSTKKKDILESPTIESVAKYIQDKNGK